MKIKLRQIKILQFADQYSVENKCLCNHQYFKTYNLKAERLPIAVILNSTAF